MNSWIRRRRIRLTIPAPIQAPAPALMTIANSNTGSTLTVVMKSAALKRIPTALPTFRVPGMSSSGGFPRSLNKAVICA
jgi:hypothetical protein